VLQGVAVYCSQEPVLFVTLTLHVTNILCVAVCCSVLQYVAVRCSVFERVAVCCSVLQCVAVLQCFAVRCSVLQRVAVCCSVLQSVTQSDRDTHAAPFRRIL